MVDWLVYVDVGKKTEGWGRLKLKPLKPQPTLSSLQKSPLLNRNQPYLFGPCQAFFQQKLFILNLFFFS